MHAKLRRRPRGRRVRPNSATAGCTARSPSAGRRTCGITPKASAGSRRRRMRRIRRSTSEERTLRSLGRNTRRRRRAVADARPVAGRGSLRVGCYRVGVVVRREFDRNDVSWWVCLDAERRVGCHFNHSVSWSVFADRCALSRYLYLRRSRADGRAAYEAPRSTRRPSTVAHGSSTHP